MGVPRSAIVAAVGRGSLVALAPGYYMRPGSIGPFPENRYLALARAVMSQMAVGTALAEVAAVGECDGMGEYYGQYSDKSLREVLDEEKFRAQELEDLGYIVVRWSWQELLTRPDVVLARIERAINRARATRFAG